MANDEYLGASFSIDVTDLKAGLSQANRLIRESESKFKAAAAGMDDWRKSEEGLTAKLESLNDITDVQEKKVAALQEEYDRLIEEGLDPTSKEATELRTKINNETAALNKNKKEAENLAKALDELRDEAEETGDELDDLGDDAEDAGDSFTIADGAIATFIGNGLSSLVGAAKDAIGSMLGLAESTREYRTILASLENSSKAAGYTVEETEKTFRQLNGVLGDAQGAATTTANLQAIGLEQSKLENLTNGVIGAWSRYGDSIPIDGLAEAVNHTVQLGEVQGTLADVIEWGGGSVDEFNEKLATCTTEAERADLIQKMLAEQGLAESGKAWQENNKNIVDANNAQAEYEKTTAALGEKVEPITTKVREGFNKILEKVLELVEDVDIEAIGDKLDTAFSWAVDEGIPAFLDGMQWIKDNIPTVTAVIGGLTAAFVAHKIALLAATAAEKGMTLAQYAAKIAQDALNASMLANPISLIILAVTALVAAFMYLWKNCEGFREFWIGLWEGLKKTVAAVVDWVKENWQAMLLFLVNPLAGIFKYCYDNFEGFRNFVDTIVQSVQKFFSNMWSGFANGAKNAWQGVKDTFSAVATFFKNIFTDAWTGVKNVFSTGGKIFDGIKDGIATAFKNIVNSIIRGINKVVSVPFNAINNVLDKIRNVKVAGLTPFKKLISQIAVPSIPQLAKGGVVRGATTAVIGEDGAEAIIPLERNKGWLKQLAKEIAAEQGNGITIHQTNNYKQAYESPLEKYKSKQQLFAAARMIKAGAY